MKNIKLFLLILLFGVLLGIISQAIFFIPFAKTIMRWSLFLIVILGIIQLVIAIKNKKHRIESIILVLASPIIMGFLFSSLYWKGHGFLLIVGVGIISSCYFIIMLYYLVNKKDQLFGLLIGVIGINSVLFLFKWLHWKGHELGQIVIVLSLIIVIFLIVKQKFKISISEWVLNLVFLLFLVFQISPSSSITRFRHISLNASEYQSDYSYYIYSYDLYLEGENDIALLNMDKAIDLVETSHDYLVHKHQKQILSIYNQVKIKIENNNWTTFDPIDFGKLEK